MMKTTPLLPNSDGIGAGAALLRAGQLVAFPTETVYGLGADARDDLAVARIFAAKARPTFNPLIVHVSDLAMAQTIAHMPDLAADLAARFWPGPLTLVLPLRADSGISPLVSAGLPTVALRMPAHPVACALIATFGGPIAAPSANPSGRISPTTAAHVLDGLNGLIAAVIDGGACAVGVESTILSLLGAQPQLLRQGGVTQEQIEAALGHSINANTELASAQPVARPLAPGQLASHYAPLARLRLNVTNPAQGEVMIGFGAVAGDFNLSQTGDLVQAASRLFALLRAADDLAQARGGDAIAIAPIPQHGLGRAMNDRLSRAAAPKHDTLQSF
jgi:L-threonylcarbamoyladenylate synthase